MEPLQAGPGNASTFMLHLLALIVVTAVLRIFFLWGIRNRPGAAAPSYCDDEKVYVALLGGELNEVSTPNAYLKILETVDRSATILDVGVGSGVYFDSAEVRRVLIEKNLTIVGVDICASSVTMGTERIARHEIQDRVRLVCGDVRDCVPSTQVWDYVLFMESFPCMSPCLFLQLHRFATESLIRPVTGKIVCYHNLLQDGHHHAFVVNALRWLKPRLKELIGVDFGRLTTVNEMRSLLPAAEITRFLSMRHRDFRYEPDTLAGSNFRWRVRMAAALLRFSPFMTEQYIVTSGGA